MSIADQPAVCLRSRCDRRISQRMLAAADDRRRKRKPKPITVRRAADLTRKRRQLERERLGLHRCELWISARAIEGLIAQLVATGKLTDKAADNYRNVETAI